MILRSFAEIAENRPLNGRLAVAGADDAKVLEAVSIALDRDLIEGAILVGDCDTIRNALDGRFHSRVEMVPAATPAECAAGAVSAVRAGEAHILMKGHVDSSAYLRAVVNRDTGIRKDGVLSNVTVAQMQSYPSLIVATDNGILPAPTLEQKRQIILNTRPLFHGLGYTQVRVAALAATEKVSDGMPATVDAAALAADDGFRTGHPEFIVDGPFGYDVAVSHAAAESKGLGTSPVAGRSDLLLFANIEAANAVAKAWKFHGDAETGSLVLGARVPVLLNSRSDSAVRRVNALLLAIAAMPKDE